MPESPRDGGWWAEAGSPPSQAAETAHEKSLQAGRGPIPGVRPHPPGPVPERAGVCLQEPSLFLTSGPRCWVRAARPPARPGSKPRQRGPSKLYGCGCVCGGRGSPVGTGLGSGGAPEEKVTQGLRSRAPKPPGQDPWGPSGPGIAPPVRKVMEAVGGRFPPPPCVFSGLRLASRSPQRRQVWWLPALLFWNLWVACGGVSRGWGGSLRCCGQHPPWSVKLLEPRGGPALHRAVPELGGAAGTVGTRCSGAVARSGQQGRVGLPGGRSSGRQPA